MAPLSSPPFSSFQPAPPSPPSRTTSQRRESVWDIIASYYIPYTGRTLSHSLPTSRGPAATLTRIPLPPRADINLNPVIVRFPRDSAHSYPPNVRKLDDFPPSPPLDVKYEGAQDDFIFGESRQGTQGTQGTPPVAFPRAEYAFGGTEGDRDVFERLARLEEYKDRKIQAVANEQEGSARRGCGFPFRVIVTLVPLLLLVTGLNMFLLVLLAPTMTVKGSGGLLKFNLGGNTSLVLGPLGGCIRIVNLEGVATSNCTSASLTPYYTPIYTSIGLNSSVASTLPFSSPLFGTTLVVVISLGFLALVLLIIPTFPNRRANPHSFAFLQIAIFLLLASLTISVSTTISLRFKYGDFALKEIGGDIGTSFGLLGAAETLWGVAVAILMWVEANVKKKGGNEEEKELA